MRVQLQWVVSNFSRLYHPSRRLSTVPAIPVQQNKCGILRSRLCTCRCYSSQATDKPKKSLVNITPFSVLVSGIAVAGMYGSYLWLQDEIKVEQSNNKLQGFQDAGMGIKPWKLTDQYGKKRSITDFKGQWVMIYFGFCHCPDICPEELEKLVDVVKGIDADKSVPDIQPIFVTLDPERDTVEYMNKYCKDFSTKLIGLTGTSQEIADVAKSYRVYYGFGDKDSDGDYIVDHTIYMYLINPDGQLMDAYQRRCKVDEIVQGSTEYMKEYRKLRKRTGQDNNDEVV